MSYGRRRGLCPVLPYAIVLVLAVALTASFFLPTRAEAKVSDHTVPTISPSGTTINLFDYWVNSDDHLSVSGSDGINKGHRFQFKDQGASDDLNRYTNGSSPRSDIVNNVLTGGYPKLTDHWDGESLRYLFDSSTQTGKISHMGVTGLLQAKGGYYEYDSLQNYAAYNANKNAFDVYDAPGVKQAGAEPHTVGQFFPFDAANEVFKEGSSGLVPNGITSQNVGDSQYNDGNPLNHYFGLSMSTRFVQPNGGLANGKDAMTFEFAGDDDVWVFIDDVLVGDIGGIHTRAELTINFQTGEITVNSSANGTLLSKFQAAGKGGSAENWNSNTFADGTNHTLKFFYLERGATDSNMKLKFNLVTVPESDIIKFDQDGKFVQGAEFKLYKTDKDFKTEAEFLGSGTTDETGRLTLTNDDDNGVINFDDLYNKGHDNKYYLLKETHVPKGYRSSLAATGGSIQLEYVPASAENGAGGVIINRGGMDAGSSVWQSGAFAGSKETITAPSTVYKAHDNLTKSDETVSPGSGILFAVVLKRDKSASTGINDPNNWYAVSGDPTKGYTLAKDQGKLGAIEAAKKDLYAFTLNTSGQYQVEIPHLPGDISKYYYLLSGEARKDAEYTVAIYHTTASSIGDATPKNTVHVYSDDIADGTNFKRQFATRLLVTNIQNRLFVQKTDTEGNPVNGAKFGLYTADQVKTDENGKVVTDENGKVVLKDDQAPYDTLTTGSVSNPISLEGTGIFPCTSDGNKPLKNGTYFLKEVSAPKGFLLNDTLTKVIVDDYGVHADAGTADDNVSTFAGPGTLMKSLGQFGAEGDIDNTLTWIKGMRQTSDGVKDGHGNLSWSNVDPAGAGDTVHLKYGANGRIYQYGPTEAGKPYRLETETGWIRMGITQDEQPKGITAKGARTDLGDMNLNALFTGATCVRVANEREASLEVTKKVDVPDGLTGNKDAKFTFKFTVPTTAGKTYKAAVFENAGAASEKQVGDMFDLENGREQTITAGQTIRVYGLDEHDAYTVQELTGTDKMPAGFTLTKREQGGNALSGEGDSISGTIAKQNADGTVAAANKLVFTNTYSVKPPVTLTNAFWAQKVLRGRDWKDGDSFKIYLRADKGTPMPAGAKDAPVSGMKQVVKTVKNGDKFDFGNIEYAKPGTYTYLIAEATPSQNDADWLPGFGYSSASYRVTVTVRDNGDGTLSQPTVKMEQTYTDDGMSHENNPIEVADKIAKITNTYNTDEKTISFHVQKTYVDQSGANPLVKDKFTFQLEAFGGMKNDAVPSGTLKFDDLTYSVDASKVPMPKGCTSTTTTAKNDDVGIAAFPQITYTMGSENLTYVYKVTEIDKSDASTSDGMNYDDTVYYVMVKNQKVKDESGSGMRLSSVATYWNANGTQLTDTSGCIPFTNTYKVDSVAEAPVKVQKTFTGRTWEADDAFDFTLTATDEVTTKAIADGVVSQKTGEDDKTGKLTTDAKITSTSAGDATRVTAFGSSDLVFTKPGTYTFNVNETKPTDVNKTGIAYDGHTSTVTYTVTDLDKDGKHTGKLTATVAYDNSKATTQVDQKVTGAAAFTNIYAASGAYAGINVTKTMVGQPLENGAFPFAIEAMTYGGVTAPAPADGDRTFTNTKGKANKDGSQTATMSGKLSSLKFTQLSYNKTYVYKVAEHHSADGNGYTFDTACPGDAYVLIAVKPNPDNKGQLYTETTIVKGPGVTVLVADGGVDALTPAAIAALGDANYKQTVSSLDADAPAPTVPFKNEYGVTSVEYGAKAGLQIKKEFAGMGGVSRAFSFTVTPEDYQAEGQDGTKFTLTSADAAAKKLGITDGSKTVTTKDMNLGDTDFVGLLSTNLQFTHDDVANANGGNVYQYQVVEDVPTPTPAGYTFDKTVYTVQIAVFDNGNGTLSVKTTVLKKNAETGKDETVDYREFNADQSAEENTATIPFSNSYGTTASDELTPQVSKQISGTGSTEKAFSFTLAATPDMQAKIAAGDLTVSDDLAGDAHAESRATKGAITGKDGQTVDFSGMKFNKAGTYTFTLSEAHDADDDAVVDGVQNAGWTMDASAYTATVTVEDVDAKLTVTGVTVKKDGDDKSETLEVKNGKVNLATFTNSYAAKGSVTLAAKKHFTGGALAGNDFSFALYKGDKAEGTPLETVTNDENGNITFQPINYTKAGEYKYTIAEQKGNLSHVTYDATVHHAVVTIVDNAGKLEASVTYDDGKTDAPTFKNTYTAKGSVELTATKVVAVAPGFTHDTKLKGGEYTFELKDADGKVLDTTTNKADGTVKFTRDFKLSDLDGAASKDFTYTIVEQPGAEAGMVYDNHPLTYKVTVTDGGNGALNAKAIVTSTSGSETFTNTYQPAATGLALGAQKSYAKKDDNTPIVLKGGEFTFDVYEGNLTAEQLKGKQPVRTATNDANGSVGFDAFSYAKPGTHEYTIVERKGDLAYVTYDAAVHHAVVTVADNAGTLQASVAYDGTDATKPTFTNTYEARATDSGAIALTKSVNVHDGSYQLKAGDFAFELMGSDGSVIQTQKNDADGKVAFDKLTFDHAGTFTYTVREVQPTDDAPGVPGVTYTGKTYTLNYVVKDNNDGKLVVESSTANPSEGTENGVSPGTMTFTNGYQPGQTSYQISGTKVLKNADPATTRTPADGEFTFALIDVATGQEIDRTTNVGNAFTFKAISYTATGSHAYQVKEVAGHDGTITYSDAVLDVTVSVTDDGSGQLTATANKTAADLTFTNTYTPTATTATITGTKALTGRDLAEGEFSFDLKDADGNVVQTVQNGADGTFGFAPLQLDKVGTYVYTVSERAGATANGVTYDTTVFTATVTVTENAETHELEAQVAYSTGGKAADAVAFCNSYAPAATEVKLGASKVLSGEDLKEGQFSFQLKDADGKVLQTAKNAADGTVGFETISYDKPGTYTYSISEVDDGQKNVTYDATEHQVTVTVTDDGAGHLVATVAYGGDVAPVFKNTYTPPVNPPVNPPTNPPSKSPVPKKEKPGLPEMGDTSLSPMALGGIAGGAVVLIAAGVILRRRNR